MKMNFFKKNIISRQTYIRTIRDVSYWIMSKKNDVRSKSMDVTMLIYAIIGFLIVLAGESILVLWFMGEADPSK